MQRLFFILIFLINFLSLKSQVCETPTKRASVIFYYYHLESSNHIEQISTIVSLTSKYQVNSVYVLNGNQTNENTLNILSIQCLIVKYNLNNCLYFQSSYISLKHISDDSCAMKIEENDYKIKTILRNLSLKQYNQKIILTCTINRINDPSKPFDQYPITETNLFTIIIFCACIALTCGLCIGWFAIIYYRRFAQERIKQRQQKELERSVQKILDQLPIIIYNSQNKDQDYLDDDSICSICLESFINNEKLRKLICSHYFHLICIDPWLLAHQNCPLCNQNILHEIIPSISAGITAANNELNNREAESIVVNSI